MPERLIRQANEINALEGKAVEAGSNISSIPDSNQADRVSELSERGMELLMEKGPGLVLALVTLIVGFWFIRMSVGVLGRAMDKRNIDISLRSFFVSLSSILLKVLLVISVAGMIGIEMTSFIAILGAAGLAVGMALSGTLQNFAGGVMILIFKPFKVGDVIEAQGYIGSVKEIQVFNTIMKTPDNKTIIIPNAPLSSGSMVNFSTESTRRVDFTFGVGYDDDIDQVKSILREVLDAEDRLLPDPEPFIVLSELADSSVNFTVRVWVNSADYWGVYFCTMEAVKRSFDKSGISIPYPQQDVHVHHQGKEKGETVYP